MVTFEKDAHATTREPTGLVATHESLLEPTRNRSLLATDRDRIAVRVFEDRRDAAIAREPARGHGGDTRAIAEDGNLCGIERVVRDGFGRGVRRRPCDLGGSSPGSTGSRVASRETRCSGSRRLRPPVGARQLGSRHAGACPAARPVDARQLRQTVGARQIGSRHAGARPAARARPIDARQLRQQLGEQQVGAWQVVARARHAVHQ